MAVGALGDATPVGSPAPGCVFCAEAAHPDALLQTERLLLIPDLYPLVPGHVLVITRRHELCMGAAEEETLAELPGVLQTASEFLSHAYGMSPILWENGVAGQTVPHAHVHLIPIAVDELAQSLVDDPASTEVESWREVAARFSAVGEYHYIQVRQRGFLVEANGAMNWEGRRRLAMAAGVGRAAAKALHVSRDEDVAGVLARWRQWEPASGL